MNSSKSILILSFTKLKNDPRVYRQILACAKEGYQVTALGLQNPEIENVEFIPVSKQEGFIKKIVLALLLLSRSFNIYYWNTAAV